MTSSLQYIDMTLVPTGEQRGQVLWIHHILPFPATTLILRKWEYITKRFHIWYEDSDGDNITLGSSGELNSAVKELLSENRNVRFQFKKGGGLVDQELLFKLMEELDNMKIRYR